MSVRSPHPVILNVGGGNYSSQVGDGTTNTVATPTIIDPGVKYKTVTAGWEYSCGITDSGELKCWGGNSYGQIGDGTTINVTAPKTIDPGVKYKAVAASYRHTCGITEGGTLRCWGDNSNGQLGSTNTTTSPLPQDVVSTSLFKSVTVGDDFTCAIDLLNMMQCWGANWGDQMGLATSGTTSYYTSPVLVDSANSFSTLATYEIACGITLTGELRCWGPNNGQIGDGTYNNVPAPKTIDAGVSYLKMAAGYQHTCGILANTGELKCWGSNVHGQLGDSTTTDHISPLIADLGTSYKEIGAGWNHTCGVTTSQGVRCWGWNDKSQLGNGLTTDSNPIDIDTGTTYASSSNSTSNIIPRFQLSSPSKNISTVNQITLTLSNLPVGLTAQLFSDPTCATLISEAFTTSSSVSYNYTVPAEGAYNFYYRLKDSNGSFSSCSTDKVTYTYDITPPNAPTSITLQSPATSPNTVRTPSFTVAGINSGDYITLYSDASCSTAVSSAVYASATSVNINTNYLFMGVHNIYAASTDAAGNQSACTATPATYEVSTQPPTANIATSAYSNTSPITFTIELSDPGLNFSASNLILTNGTLASFTGSGRNFTATVTPSGQGFVAVQIPVGAIEYPAGNLSTAAFSASSKYDTIAPYVTLSTLEDAISSSSSTLTVDVQPSEPLTLSSGHFTCTNCTSYLTNSGGIYKLTLTPTITDGTISIKMPAGVVTDGINPNLASNIITLQVAKPRIVQFDSYGKTVLENAGAVSVNLVLDTAHPTDNLSIDYEVVQSVAGLSSDLSSGTVQIPAGQTTASINFTLNNDAIINYDRYIDIKLIKSSQPITGFGRHHNYRVLIQDDEAASTSPVTKVVSSIQGACSLHANGALKCWGFNASYNLGTATNLGSYLNPTVIYASGVADFDLSGNYGCAVMSGTGELQCWGTNSSNVLGISGTVNTPKTIIASGVKQVSISKREDTNWNATFCAVMSGTGELRCWGWNDYGQVGNGSASASVVPITSIIASGVAQVSVGVISACAVMDVTGELRCWGAGGYTGDGTTTQRLTPYSIVASGISKVVAGNLETCLITTTGALQCWGQNYEARLGTISSITYSPTTLISSGVLDVSVAPTSREGFGCAVKNDNSVWCWGYEAGLNYIGINGWRSNFSATPSKVMNETATGISVYGSYNSYSQSGLCILTTTGEVKCLGGNSYQMNGWTHSGDEKTPKLIASAIGIDFFGDSMYFDTFFFKKSDGSIYAQGDNPYYQLGDRTNISKSHPVYIHGLSGATKIESKFNNMYYSKKTCALMADQTLKCWYNSNSKTYVSSIQDFSTGTNAWNVGAGAYHMCYVTTAGALRCEGNNAVGQLGIGNTSSPGSTVTPISANAAKVFTGPESTCALLTDNSLQCWGKNSSGKLATGLKTDQLSPMTVMTNVVEVALGQNHSCVRTTTGDVYCAGQNSAGQLGISTATPELLTYSSVILSGAQSIKAGSDHTCALLAGGEVKCWGMNSYGQVGDGTTTNNSTPTTVIASGATKIYASNLRTCAVMSNADLKCWGAGSNGDLDQHLDWLLRPIFNLNYF